VPKIPTVDAPQALSTQMPVPQAAEAPPGSFGEPVIEGVEALAHGAGVLGDSLQKASDRYDAAAVEQGLASTQDYFDGALSNYRNESGENAAAAHDAYQNGLRAYQEEVVKGFANDRQRKLYSQRASLLAHHTFNAMEDHQAQQNEVVVKQAEAAIKASTLRTLSAHAHDSRLFGKDSAVHNTIDTYVGTHLAKSLDRQGLGAEETEIQTPDPEHPGQFLVTKSSPRAEAVAEFKNEAYSTVLQELAAPQDGRLPDPKTLRDFYDLHKDDLEPKTAAHYAGIVRGFELRQGVEDATTKLLTEHSSMVKLPNGKDFRVLDGPAMSASIDGLKMDPDMKAKVRSLGDSMVTEYAKQWKVQQGAIGDGAYSEYLKKPTKGLAALESVNPMTLTWLKEHAPDEYGKLFRIAQNDELHEKQMRDGAVDTMPQLAAVIQLMRDLSPGGALAPLLGDPATGAKEIADIAAQRGLGDKGKKAVLMRWQENATQMAKKDPAAAIPKDVETRAIEGMNKLYGEPPKKPGRNPQRPETWNDLKTPQGTPRAAVFFFMVDQLKAFRESQKGTDIKPSEWDAEVDRLLDVVVQQRHWYGDTKSTVVEEQLREKQAAEALEKSRGIVDAAVRSATPSAKAAPSVSKGQAVPQAFVDRVLSTGRKATPEQIKLLWEKNKATWKGK
jgi:hypothetical protein